MPTACAARRSLSLSPIRKLRDGSTGQVCDQVEQHAGLRLAPVGIDPVGGERRVGMKRTEADVVDARAVLFASSPRMWSCRRATSSSVNNAAGDAGLVRDDEDVVAGLVQPADRRCAAPSMKWKRSIVPM
jgi:hypothetical protein